jgi:hypothetical protein
MQFEFKEAKIVQEKSIATGNRYQVRVLPDQINVPPIDNANLPYFSNFLKDVNDAYRVDDTVWILVNDDYQVGFILGLAQSTSGDDLSSTLQTINEAEKEAGFMPVSGYNQLKVIQLAGSSFSFYNVVLGRSGTIYNNKTIMLYGAEGTMWFRNPGMSLIAQANGDIKMKGRNKTEEVYSETTKVKTASTEDVGTKILKTASNVTEEIGGNKSVSTAFNSEDITGIASSSIVTGVRTETYGAKMENVGAGSITNVATIGWSLNVILGVISIAAAGPIAITSASAVAVTAPSVTILAANINTNPLGTFVVPNPLSYAGRGGPFNCLPICPLTFLPHQGSSTIL